MPGLRIVMAALILGGFSNAQEPAKVQDWTDAYRTARELIESDRLEEATPWLERAIGRQSLPSVRRVPGTAGHPYVPYLDLAEVHLRARRWNDAELCLSISENFAAYTEHKPSRKRFTRLTEALQQQQHVAAARDDD